MTPFKAAALSVCALVKYWTARLLMFAGRRKSLKEGDQ